MLVDDGWIARVRSHPCRRKRIPLGLQLNDASSQNQTHSVENMVMLMAGRLGGLSPGEHVNGNRAQPATVLISAMQAAGYQGNSLGDVSL